MSEVTLKPRPLQDQVGYWKAQCMKHELKLALKETQLKLAIEALEKYANPATHSKDKNGFTWSGDCFDYETAIEALEQIKGSLDE